MGNWKGHVLPGTFFFAVGFYWAMKYSYRLITKKTTNVTSHQNGKVSNPVVLASDGVRLRNIKTYPSEFWEGVTIVCMWVIGVMVELPPKDSFPYRHVVMFDDSETGRPFIFGNKWQHITMYTFFGIYGLTLILARTCVAGLRDHEKIFIALAYFVEGLLFYFHVHGRTFLDITVHYMLVITIAMNTISAAAENWRKDDVLLRFISTLFIMVQGTWFWQAAYILYPPNSDAKWDEDSHASVMFATFAYCWHIAANLLIIAGVYGLVSTYVHVRGKHKLHVTQSRYAHVDDVETELTLLDHPSDDDSI
ncbi:transmembrane protein 45A-like [Glandiceps talaboti]